MRENISKVAERGERLDSLQDKTGAYSALRWSWVFGKGDYALPSDSSPSHDGSDRPTVRLQTTLLFLHKDSVVGRIEFARYVSYDSTPT